MEELILLMKKPNKLEEKIIEWDMPSLKKLLVDHNQLYSLGYSSDEIAHMQVMFFGIKIPNPAHMTYFEKAVYHNDKKTILNYYKYMAKSKSAMESCGYTQDDLKNIRYVHIANNVRFAASVNDSYEIATRLYIMQKNKNRMAEMYFIKYLKEEAEPLHKKEVINSLSKIYREEEYKPERLADFERLVSLYPEMLEYSQLNRSFYIEILYRNVNNPNRYQRICELGDYYNRQLQLCKQRENDVNLSEDEKNQIKQEKRKYILEDKAKYLYAISLFKNHKNGWKYFLENRLYEQTNVTYMRDFLEAAGDYLKIYLEFNKQDDGIYYSDILHKMAEKATGKRGNSDYSFLLYLNREFGPEYGIDWNGLEELYRNADHESRPFEYNGYGSCLYALAEEYVRIHKSLDGFPYIDEYLRLKKEFYGFFVKNIERNLISSSTNSETIRYQISLINNSILTGERKLLSKDKYSDVNERPRYLCFFPEQDKDLSNKYEEAIQNDIKLAREKNISKNMLKNLRISKLPNQDDILDEKNDEVIEEISFYLWKKIQYSFDDSKDQWLMLAKIYEYYMNRFLLLSKKESNEERKSEYIKLYTDYTNKLANALKIRAELAFVYDDWYDLYQYYLKQAADALAADEKMAWIKSAYELYLEIAYKIQDDIDQTGRHFAGLREYFFENRNNFFKLCIMKENEIAAKYIEELARLYDKYHHYRYLKFAFEITKVTKDYDLYLQNFLLFLVQWEMVQLISNIHYLLRMEEYETAQKFYDLSAEHINNIPEVLNYTKTLIDDLKATGKPFNNNIYYLLVKYPNIKKHQYIADNDEKAMLDNIKALKFIIGYYTSTKELTGEMDCSSIRYALYLQYKQLYFKTMKDEYLRTMKETLVSAGEEKEYLPYLYKAITLCYRYEQLNQYSDTIVEKMNISPVIAGKLDGYRSLLEKLKAGCSNRQDQMFQELCDLTLHCTNETIDETLNDIKDFIKKYIFSDEKFIMTRELKDYLMSFDMINKVWLQLYFEQNSEKGKGRTLSVYAIDFFPVNKVLYILENSSDDDKSVLNTDLLKACVYSTGFDSLGMDNPYVMLVLDYLKNNSSTGFEGAELLHYFFASMEKNDGPALYEVIDTINEASEYNNEQCLILFEQLYKETNDYSYLTGLARQYAKSCNYSRAEKCYREILERVKDNPNMAKRYSYIKNHACAIDLIIRANNNEKIKISAMEDITAKQVCEVLAYISDKYSDEVPRLIELLSDDEERKLFDYIHQLITCEKYVNDSKTKGKNKVPADAYEEAEEKDLFEKLLLLHGTVYFDILLPNLYQRSRSGDFKYYIESTKDYNIQAILKEANNKPVLYLSGQRMAVGQKLLYMDYERQSRNVDMNINFLEDTQETPLLQRVINKSRNKNNSPIKDLFDQLDRENYDLGRRKSILLNILSYRPDNPEDIEKDALLQKRLQQSKAELGYLIYQEEIDKNYEKGLQVLHEGIIYLRNNKSESRILSEKIRDSYLEILEKLPDIPIHESSKLLPGIIYDLKKILRILDNDNNYKNVFLKEMLYIISSLQTCLRISKEINNNIELLETLIGKLVSLRTANKAIRNITGRWICWLYNELIKLVDMDTIKDVKYFIDRRESKISLSDLYLRLISNSDNINIYGPKGVGVSSLLWQCCQLYSKDALQKGHLLLYIDVKEIAGYYDKEDEYGFSRKIIEHLRQGIGRLFDEGSDIDTDILDDIEQANGVINCFKIIKREMKVGGIHLFLDHYDDLEKDAGEKMDLLLKYLIMNDIQLVAGSEAAIKVMPEKFKEIELAGFSENETEAYINSRLQNQEEFQKPYPVEKIHKLTGGIPVLLGIMAEYMLENKRYSEADGKAYIISKARLLFERWDRLWQEKLDNEDNEAYHSYLKTKKEPSIDEDNIKNKLDKIEKIVNDNASKLSYMETRFQLVSKEIFIRKYNLYDREYINLESYQKSTNWTQEAEVDPAEYGMPEDIWDLIKDEHDVYRYIKYGEALKKELLKLRPEERIKDYDYSGFALNYCLAFEMICHKLLKNFLVEKIPEYNLEFMNRKNLKRLKDSKSNTRFTLGNYSHFLYYFKDKYYIELNEASTGFKMSQFTKDFSEATNIRNTVAHVGDSLEEEKLNRFLLLLFGSKDSRGKNIPVFEGICRLIRIN